MKKKNVLFLTDSCIYFKNNSNIIKHPVNKGIVINSKIADVDKFNKVFSKFMKKNNLNNTIFGDVIKVIINKTWTNSDMFVIKYILQNNNYRKIEFIYDIDSFSLNNKNAYLEIWDNYMILDYLDDYKKNNTILITNNMFNSIDSIMDYIANIVCKKELFLLGYGSLLQEIFNKFEDTYNISTYIYSNNETYLLDNN